MASVAMPLWRAIASPPASARLEITTAISAGKSAAFAASISAAMFDPRPEIRMATRRFIASQRQVEMAVIDHAVMLAAGIDHFAQQRDALAAFGEHACNPIDCVGLHNHDHP